MTAFAVVAALSQLHDLTVAVFVLLAVALVTLAAGIERRLLRCLLHVEGFVLLLITLPFVVEGRPVLTYGPLAASAEGIARAALVACKVSVAALILMLFLGAVEVNRLGAALQSLRVPETIVRLLVMMVRYLSLIREEAHRLREFMRARAFHPRSNRHTWRSYGYLIGMLLVRALERADRVEEAMRCRRAARGSFMNDPIVLDAVTVTRDGNAVLKSVSMSLSAGERLAIVGLETAEAGEVRLFDEICVSENSSVPTVRASAYCFRTATTRSSVRR
ncbi:cobalt ECF transporter T component CbiQ [Breoghania sp.]|uniref:cobalt ECF transporter T component CbiQ n=1 Tax=Breoghania sp. TaxID=2065378 RepID=UPI0026104C31|nr:cobalt ECF transporter T component CbiQ [Breoghania sp.]MDJ0933289.1 cobalt ECF transporter T component CbiQ [Breoghania sp.]